ncbi:hypothetical protein CK203_019351 [Vitis vinifera]|uniref:Late embryogenesis abundant protein LEA-2 subgroup domain-containing protein n=1 Tax=Vitis vinifera TaxID=29760 RepID=A0A438IYN8_VITVI|nr:hypothetical protein CK203_019351 [Vitis vinifera]
MSSNYEHVGPVAQSAELRRKKRIKYIAYFAAFVVFQTLVITAFALTAMRIKNPKTPISGTSNSRIALSRCLWEHYVGEAFIAKARVWARSTRKKCEGPKFRLRSVAIEDLSHTSNTTSSFNIRFNAQVTVKNLNFGHYKFKSSTITFAYGATMVGEAFILRLECKQDPPERSMLQLGIVLHPVQSDGTVVLNYSPADSGTRDSSLAAPLGRGKTTGSCLLPHRKEYKPAITIDMPSKLHGLQLELLV